MKGKSKILVFILLFLFLVGGTAGGMYYWKTTSEKELTTMYDAQIADYNQQLNSLTQTAYVAIADIPTGQLITAENVMEQAIRTDQMCTYIDASDIGKIAAVDILAGDPVYKSMCYAPVTPEGSREYQCSLINLSANMGNNDFIDIRIAYADGEDFVVLPKKQIYNVQVAQNSCYLMLSEEEIIVLQSAFLDAAQIPSTRVYATRYSQPNTQEASVITYPFMENPQALVEKSPNTMSSIPSASVAKRQALMKRLIKFMNISVGEDGESGIIMDEQGNYGFGTTMEWPSNSITRDDTGTIPSDPSINVISGKPIEQDEEGDYVMPEGEAATVPEGEATTVPEGSPQQ